MQLPAEPLAVVQGDLERLTQVVSNLLHNAAKFTPPRGSIRITVEADDAHATLRVRDSGAGISPELLPSA